MQKVYQESEVKALQKRRVGEGRALFNVRGDQIEWVDVDRCYVPGKARPRYLVVFGEEGERCGCPDFQRLGEELGMCKHTVAARISFSQIASYHVRKRHDSRLGREVWDLVETKAGVDRIIEIFDWVGNAYARKWALENGEAA